MSIPRTADARESTIPERTPIDPRYLERGALAPVRPATPDLIERAMSAAHRHLRSSSDGGSVSPAPSPRRVSPLVPTERK